MSWTKTRYCACDKCRFHATSEPGWEKCPVPVNSPEYKNGRWLWIKNILSGNLDLERADEDYVSRQRKTTVYEDVASL